MQGHARNRSESKATRRHIANLPVQTATFSRSWSYAVSSDFKWLDSCSAFGNIYGYEMMFSSWVDAFSSCPAEVGRKVMKFCATPFANISTQWVVPKLAGLCSPLSCQVCGKQEDTTQKLKMHMFKSHGIKDNIRLYVDSTHRTICLKEFHQRENVSNHLKKVTFCNQQLRLRRPCLTVEQADSIDTALRAHNRGLNRAGKRRHAKDRPCRQGEGPKLPCIVGPVPQRFCFNSVAPRWWCLLIRSCSA